MIRYALLCLVCLWLTKPAHSQTALTDTASAPDSTITLTPSQIDAALIALADLAECHAQFTKAYQIALLYKSSLNQQSNINTLLTEQINLHLDDIELYKTEIAARQQTEKRLKRTIFWQRIGTGALLAGGVYAVIKLSLK